MQFVFVIVLNTLLADVVIGGVVFCQTFLSSAFRSLSLILKHSQDMRQCGPIGVLAVFIAIDIDATEMKLVNRETGDFYIGQRIFSTTGR